MKKILLVLAAWVFCIYADAQMKVISFSPLSGPVGSRVTITGGVFKPVAEENTVYFGAVKAKVDSAGPNILLVRVPAGASYEPITVIANNQVANSRTPFTVTKRGTPPAVLLRESFMAAKSFPTTAMDPRSVLTTDLNNDGKPEIITTNQTSGSVSIFRNVSNPGKIDSFPVPAVLSSITSPYHLLAADLNGDSKKEIIVGNNNVTAGVLSVIPNTSSGDNITFAPKFDSSLGTAITGIAASDINSDGKLDLLAFSGTSNILYYFLNTGSNGSYGFAPRKIIILPTHMADFSLVDINGDQKNDIALSSSSGISILLNTSDSTTVSFKQPKLFARATFTETSKIISVDINLDGKPDLAQLPLSTTYNEVLFFINTSTVDSVIIDSIHRVALSTSSSAVTFSDIDANGSLDLLATSSHGNDVYIYQNRSDNKRFNITTAQYTYPYTSTTPTSVIASDIDLDGMPDIIFTNPVSNSIGILRNNLLKPKIIHFSPEIASAGDTITIKGNHLLGITDVRFGNIAASSIHILQDSVIKAVVGSGASGNVKVSNTLFSDSLGGFSHTASPPGEISFTPTGGLQFTASKNLTTQSQSYKINAAQLTDILVITAPMRFQVSRNSSFGFADTLMIAPLNGRIDSLPIYVRFRSDSAIALVSDSIVHSSKGSKTRKFSVKTTMLTDSTGPFIYLKGAVQFTVKKNTPTPVASYKVTGNRLTANIDIFFPQARLQVSRFPDSGFVSQLSLLPVNGKLDTTTIYVRLIYTDGLPDSTTINIAHSSASAENRVMPVKILLEKDTLPSISILTPSGPLQFFAGQSVTTQPFSYIVSATELQQNLQVIAPTHFQVSRTPDSGFAQQLTLIPVNKKIDTTRIYVRFRNDSIFTVVNDSIAHISTGAITRKIPVKATFSNSPTAGKPVITSFSPTTAASNGSTIIIKGKYFTGVTHVSFGDSAAKTFTVISDSLINAIVGNARSGFIRVRNIAGTDSIAGFTFSGANNPSIVLFTATSDGSILFNAVKGVLSKPLSYKVTCSQLLQDLTIAAPKGLQVSISVDSGYSQQLLIKPVNGSIDRFIYIKYKTDSLAGYFIDSVIHSSPGAVTKTLITRIRVCDTAHPIKPVINQITTDSSIVCFKDSITLSISNQGNASRFLWHNGDTTATIRIGASTNAQVVMATNTSCFSTPSNLVRFIKNTNTKPSIGISSDSILISTTAPFYRWYFNNIRSNGDTSNRLIARKVGFYRVETSVNRQCWDASDDFPVVTLARTASTDTVKVRIFPNPITGGTFTVVASLERVTNVVARVMVTDASGLVLAQTNRFIFYGREIKIPITLSTYKGTAFVRVEINGDAETKTIILQ